MYVKDAPVSLKGSASLLCNNLAILKPKEKESTSFAVVHKALVCLSNVAKGGGVPSIKQISCKGEGAHSSSAVQQAKWCILPDRTVLVLASIKGVQMFDPDGMIMIFWQSLPPCEATEVYSQFSRGICAVGEKYICVGSSDGGIMVFDVPARGTGVKLQETLSTHAEPICDLVGKDSKMVSSDDTGYMIVWQAGGHFTQLSKIDGFGFPCSSLALYKEYVVGGYGTGHIRIFNLTTGKIVFEICAHAQWVNALDVAEENGLLLSVSEDTFVRVWQVNDGESPKVELKFQQNIIDTQLCGGRFLDQEGHSFGITGYDLTEVSIFSKK
ncbi:WD repeat-containing protein 54 [Exaiptasia diaphana]|uniref:WD repeat-containing protein 54 beta-propeller domain-containing protein n=1 Tax=Exaiptasia diaphana TaxID=2652724 RepID=A0A913WPZ6_EXADI|nr:WD repeat-containing protein 54 [Exaiptasia diaphana]KXJ18917.1 WD repeat-containing protein 54 [Exaiptasia diaphana]